MLSAESKGRSEADALQEPSGWQRAYLVLAIVTAVMVAMMTYIYMGAERLHERHMPLADASMEIRLEATTGYLWFEELMGGSREASLPEIFEHFDRADWFARAMLDGGKSSKGTYLPSDDPRLRRNIEDLRGLLAEFRQVAEARYAGRPGEGPGTELDRRQHEIFLRFTAGADAVERSLQAMMDREGREFRRTQVTLIIASLVAALLAGLSLHRFEHNRRRYLRDLDRARREAEVSEGRYRNLFELSNDAVFLHDTRGRILNVNARASELLGFSAEQLRSMSLADLHVPETRQDAATELDRLLATGGVRFDTRLARSDGTAIDVEVSARLVDRQEDIVQGIVRDIGERNRAQEALQQARDKLEERVKERTAALSVANRTLEQEVEERRRAETALRESEEKYSTLVESSATGVFIFQDDQFVFVNQRFATLLGYSREELIGRSPAGLIHPEDWGWVAEIGRRRLVGEEAPTQYETRVVTKDGRTAWLNMNNALIQYRGRPATMGNVVDVTERRAMEQALTASQRELRILSARLLSAQEAERGRIARELHDGLGQSLSAIKFLVENLVAGFDLAPEGSPREELATLVPRIQQTVEEVRRISMALRPSILDDLGLTATLSWLCRELQAAHPGLQVLREVSLVENRLPDELKTVIYRVLQEAVNNVTRHSGARRVRVRVAEEGDLLELLVDDDGRGFDPEALRVRRPVEGGFGLGNMKERTELSGGHFSLDSAPGKGTRVRAVWVLASP